MTEIKTEAIDVKLRYESSETNSFTTTSRKSTLEESHAEVLEEQLFIMKTEQALDENDVDNQIQPSQQQEQEENKSKSRKRKTHICPICQHTFAQGSNLKRHMILHSGEKPHVCEECGRTFTTASNLKAHCDTHKEKDIRNKHTCTLCKKSFFYKCSLVKHEKRRHSQLFKKDFIMEDDVSLEVPKKKVVKKERLSSVANTQAIVQPTVASTSSLPETNVTQFNMGDVVTGNMFNYWLFGQFQEFLNRTILSGNGIPQEILQAAPANIGMEYPFSNYFVQKNH